MVFSIENDTPVIRLKKSRVFIEFPENQKKPKGKLFPKPLKTTINPKNNVSPKPPKSKILKTKQLINITNYLNYNIMKALFNIGNLVATSGISECMAVNPQFSLFCQKALQQHIKGEWGDLPQEDTEWNIEALNSDERIFSRYMIPEDLNIKADTKIYIITEGDRSVTTILFSSEY